MLWELQLTDKKTDRRESVLRSCVAVRRIVQKIGGLRGILNATTSKEDLTSLLRSVLTSSTLHVRLIVKDATAFSVFYDMKEILRIVPDATVEIAKLAFDMALEMSMTTTSEDVSCALKWSQESIQVSSRFGDPESETQQELWEKSHFLRADIFVSSNEIKKASEEIDAVEILPKSNPDVWFFRTKIACAAAQTGRAIESHEKLIHHPNTPNFETVMEATRMLAEHLGWKADAILLYVKTANVFAVQSLDILLEILGIMLPSDRVDSDKDSLLVITSQCCRKLAHFFTYLLTHSLTHNQRQECEASIRRIVSSHLDKDVTLSSSNQSAFQTVLWNFVVKTLTLSKLTSDDELLAAQLRCGRSCCWAIRELLCETKNDMVRKMDTYCMEAMLHIRAGRVEDANEILNKTVRKLPEAEISSNFCSVRLLAALHEDNNAVSRTMLEKLLRCNETKDMSQRLVSLARCAIGLNRCESALMCIEHVLSSSFSSSSSSSSSEVNHILLLPVLHEILRDCDDVTRAETCFRALNRLQGMLYSLSLTYSLTHTYTHIHSQT
jgi:hypothetical protein